MTDLTTDPEKSLLTEIMNRPAGLNEVEGLEARDFEQPRYGALWDLIQWLDAKRIAPSTIALSEHLHRIDLPGCDVNWLAEIATAGHTRQPTGILGRMVRERADLRRLEQACMRGLQMTKAGGDPQELQEIVRSEVDAATRAVASVASVNDRIDATLASWESPQPASIPTPWRDLTEFIGGWRPGALYVIGARPSVGKSLMGLQAALDLSRYGAASFHSLEMPESEVHTRLISQMSLVPQTRIDRRELTAADWQKVMDARAQLADLPLFVDDRATVRPVDVRSHTRSMARKRPVAGVVVDYLQLMTPARGDKRPRHEQVGEWSRLLKMLAKEMNIPVIVLAQLNRDAAAPSARPTLAHLKASGDIEQDADVVILLHEDPNHPEDLLGILDKNRQGQKGEFMLTRRGHLARLDTPGEAPWTPSHHAAAAS